MATLSRVDAISDRTLNRLLKWGAIAFAVLLVLFSVIYYFGRHVDSGPTLGERQMTSAEELVKAKPNNIAARMALAVAYVQNNRPADAVAQYEEILKATPKDTNAMIGEGAAKIALGDNDGAAALFQKVLKASKGGEFSSMDTSVQTATYWLGAIAVKQGNHKDAVKYLQQALKMDGGDADAWYQLGSSQLALGNAKDAVTSLARAVAFVPTGWCEPYTAMAQAYSQLKAPEMAEYAGAMVDFCTKKPESAQTRLEALTTGSAAVPALLGLGMVAESQGDASAAVSRYQQALKADPGNEAATRALAGLKGTDTHSAASAAPTTQAKAG